MQNYNAKKLKILTISSLIFLGFFCFVKISQAAVFFEFDGESGYQYMGGSNKHPGGGYFGLMGGNITKSECPTECPTPAECQTTCYNTRLSNEAAAQGAVPGSSWSLKTPYSGACPNESYVRDTTAIKLDSDKTELYIRFYQKFTGDWNSCNLQHKFIKVLNHATTLSVAQFSFSAGVKNLRSPIFNIDGHFDKGTVREAKVWVYSTQAGSNQPSTLRSWDDYDNKIDAGNDGEFYFETNRWYCIEAHFKMNSDIDTADGIWELWVDGVKIFRADNFKYFNVIPFGMGVIELQHVYYDRSATDQPTFMDNIVVADQYIGPVQTPSDTTPPAAPSGVMVQ